MITAAVGGEGPTWESTEQEHAALVKEIRAFDQATCVTIVAGLLTFPQFHANTIRLEVLQHIIQRNAQGKNQPTRNAVGRWLNQHLGSGHAARMEDPVEDVFISNIINHFGNNRVFEGIWEANDFWGQEVFDVLRGLCDHNSVRELMAECSALLCLSEVLAQRCNLPRFCMGGGGKTMVLPSQSDLYTRAALTRFSYDELCALNISPERLIPFVHQEEQAKGASGNSSLERRPLIRNGNGYILALPTAISPAIRKHVVESLVRLGLVDKFEQLLFSNQANETFNEGVRMLGGHIIDDNELPPLPENTNFKIQELCSFDDGKYAHILFGEDDVLGFLQSGLCETVGPNTEQSDILDEHIRACASAVAKRTGYTGGLTIAIVGGLGRGFFLGMPELTERWYGCIYRLSDFLALERAESTKFLDIWKLKQQVSEIYSRGIEINNFNGDLNLLGYWQNFGMRLIPRETEIDLPNSIMVGNNFIAKVRRDLRHRYDRHAVKRRNPNIWCTVNRYNTHPFFKEIANSPMFADYSSAQRGKLRGCVETSNRVWWVSCLQKSQIERCWDTQYRIWDAILGWLLRAAFLIEDSIPELPQGPIEFFLHFEDLETWTTKHLKDLPAPAELELRIDPSSAAIHINIPVGFLNYFTVPKNIGERKLIGVLIRGAAELSNFDLADLEIEKLVQKIVRNDETRFFHVAYAQTFRQHAAGYHGFQPRVVKEGDINFAYLGLCWRAKNREEGNNINEKGECNKFLHTIVDECWSNICKTLQTLNRASVVKTCFDNIEAISCEREQWRMTARALLALYNDREDVMQSSHERDIERIRSEISSRTLIEMAICSSPMSGGENISSSMLDELMARVVVMLYAANASDALKYELAAPPIQLFSNGEFEIDGRYQREVMQPYMAGEFSEEFECAAANYDSYYSNPDDKSKHSPKASFPAAFTAAFLSEYGITPDELIKIYEVIEDDAMREPKLVIQRTRIEFSRLLTNAGLDSTKVDCIFEHFVLSPRQNWGSVPQGFSIKDIQPWRFRRRLSVIARPFVELDKGEASQIVYAPGLVSQSVELLIVRALTGRFPTEYFRTSAMRSWVGEATREKGDGFEKLVKNEFEKNDLQARASIQMTEFGADSSYGDLDCLAWDEEKELFFAVESKRLRFARTVAEMGEQLRNFKGEEKDRLARHIRRCSWLEAHPDAVCRVARVKAANPQIIPLLVTNTIVPMQFVKGLPLPPQQIVALNALRTVIASSLKKHPPFPN